MEGGLKSPLQEHRYLPSRDVFDSDFGEAGNGKGVIYGDEGVEGVGEIEGCWKWQKSNQFGLLFRINRQVFIHEEELSIFVF